MVKGAAADQDRAVALARDNGITDSSRQAVRTDSFMERDVIEAGGDASVRALHDTDSTATPKTGPRKIEYSRALVIGIYRMCGS